MKLKTKWIDVSASDQIVSEVAKLVIAARLEVVNYYLPLAATQANEDLEHVHQLRVSSRRAGAAIRLFQDLIPRKTTKAATRWLRRLRQAAGAARDDDVMLVRIETSTSPETNPRSAEFQAKLQEHRAHAQRAILKIYERSQRKKWRQVQRDLIEQSAWREESVEPRFHLFARIQLQSVISSFLERSRQVTEDGRRSDVDSLHRLRVVGKRLRYSMELVAAEFPAAFRKELYPLVEQLQDRLGDLNDHVTARRRYHQWFSSTTEEEFSAELARLFLQEHDAAKNSVQEFHEWWSGPQSAKLQEGLNEILVNR